MCSSIMAPIMAVHGLSVGPSRGQSMAAYRIIISYGLYWCLRAEFFIGVS